MASKFTSEAHEGVSGREYIVEVNVTQLRRVKSKLGVDLLELLRGDLLAKLWDDPVLLCDVVYVLCQDQAEKAGISDEQFGCGMKGDAIDRARSALLDELISFCPSPAQRQNLSRAIKAIEATLAKAQQRVKATLDSGAMERALDKALDQSMRQSSLMPSGEPSGAVPESSALTPAPSP
jgi:peptide subunit release factor RF-3